MSDYALISLAPKRPGNFPQGVPDSAGIPHSVREEMLVAPFNDIETVASLIREHRDELAGIIIEPFQRLIPPAPGFLQALRKITAEHGIPLIFDEVVNRVSFRLWRRAGILRRHPDLCTLGKVIGGGFPLAAIAGRADMMAISTRASSATRASSCRSARFPANPVAAVAGLATLDILKRPGPTSGSYATGRELKGALSEDAEARRAPGASHR